MKLRVISQTEIRQLISMVETIEVVKQAFAQLSGGEADVPVRDQLEVAQHEGIVLFMPAYLRKSNQLGLKIVSVFPKNLSAGIPTIHALVIVVDATTGQPTAVIDGTYLTALRTGAASGASTDLLARPDSKTVAIFGAGVQGRTQLEAICAVRDIERVRVFDVSQQGAETFVNEMCNRGDRIPSDIAVAGSAADAVRDADVICTATTAREPVFNDSDLKPGAHINAVGAFTPDTREVPTQTIQRARLFVDSREACWAEAGDLIIPRSQGLISELDIAAELGELVSGTAEGRTAADEITFFKSVGNAIQDVAVAGKILEEAARRGLGMEVEV
jgi:alanine dehydrogenase